MEGPHGHRIDPMDVLEILGHVMVGVQRTEAALDVARSKGERPPAGSCPTHRNEDCCRGHALMNALHDEGLDVVPKWVSDQAKAMVNDTRHSLPPLFTQVEHSRN